MGAFTFIEGVHEVTPSGWGGVGPVDLGGAAAANRLTFAAAGVADQARVKYRIDNKASEWEVVAGKYDLANNQISRDRVIASSAGGAKVNFNAGVKDVVMIATSEDFLGTPDGECRLELDTGNLVLKPFDGNVLVIDAVRREVPAAGVTLAPTGLAIDTDFYIYAAWVTGAMVLEASATGHSSDAATGHEVKTGDATRRLVGLARTIAGPAWADTEAQRLVASWFNRRRRVALKVTPSTLSTSSGSFVELSAANRAEFLTWGPYAASAFSTLNQTGALGSTAALDLGIDGAAVGHGAFWFKPNLSNKVPAHVRYGSEISEGYHFASQFGSASGGTGEFQDVTGSIVEVEI